VCCEISDTSDGVTLDFDVGAEHLADERFKSTQLDDEQLILSYLRIINLTEVKSNRVDALFTAKLPSAALAARCTSVSWLERRKRIGSRVSRPTSRTSFSVISAKASAALRCRSTFSEKESVVSAESGEPVKKLVVVRSSGRIRSLVGSGWNEYALSRY
jgi:hypothetical protein